jgi:hypothetical protein
MENSTAKLIGPHLSIFKPSESLSEDEKRLFELIPLNGDPIGNKAVRTKLAWDDEKYWKIRNDLVVKGIISTGMGRGGSVYRLIDVSLPPAELTPILEGEGDYALEKSLYDPVSDSLNKWAKELQFSDYFIENISSQGSRRTGGVWTRPDLVLVNVSTYQFVPNKFLEVITFEIKPSGQWSIESVFEAAAHSRFASESYLCLHRNIDNPPSPEIETRIAEECKRFGVGLIIFENPKDYDSYEFQIEPDRTPYDPREIEKFIETQISAENKNKLSRWLR